MYVRTHNKAKTVEWKAPSPGPLRATHEYYLRAPFQARPGLAQPPTPVPKCVTFSGSLPLLPHFHIRKLPVIVAVRRQDVMYGDGTKWLTSSVPLQMAPQSMDPGFLDSGRGTFRVNPPLDQKLKSLLADLLANKPPFDNPPYTTFVGSGARISVALVDLSTNAKLMFPHLAEFRSTVETEAASLAKIAALYAAHQLRFDLNREARQNPRSMTASRLAGLRTIFEITQVGGATPVWNFEFNSKLKEELNKLCHNCGASFVIGKLGTAYISSVLRQSGLYDCRLGGLWVGTTYAGSKEMKEECPDVAQLVAKLHHVRDPIGNFYHGATALSAAAFFTLLAQGRLVDDATCQNMRNVLVYQKNDLCESRFETGLNNAGLPVFGGNVFSKIGVLPTKVHCSRRDRAAEAGLALVNVLFTKLLSLKDFMEKSRCVTWQRY